jgi:NADH-quinone oxidoreductase subunit L
MARLFLIVFRGNYRTERAKKAEESPAIMTVPIVVLAIFAVTLGAVVIPIANYQGLGTFIDASHHFRMLSWLTVMSSLIAICGMAVGWLYYGTSRLSPEKMSLRLGAFYRVIINKYYVDEIYQWVIDNLILAFSKFLAVFDRVVVNDTGIDGAGMSVLLSAIKVRLIHTGRLYNYSTAMVFGLLTVAIFWWFI